MKVIHLNQPKIDEAKERAIGAAAVGLKYQQSARRRVRRILKANGTLKSPKEGQE